MKLFIVVVLSFCFFNCSEIIEPTVTNAKAIAIDAVAQYQEQIMQRNQIIIEGFTGKASFNCWFIIDKNNQKRYELYNAPQKLKHLNRYVKAIVTKKVGTRSFCMIGEIVSVDKILEYHAYRIKFLGVGKLASTLSLEQKR